MCLWHWSIEQLISNQASVTQPDDDLASVCVDRLPGDVESRSRVSDVSANAGMWNLIS